MFAYHRLARRFAALASLTALSIALPCATVAAPDPVEINVLVAVTGSLAPLGKSTQSALAILEDSVNKAGGIAGRPLKFVITDDQSNPQLDVQFMTRFIEAKPAVIVGPNSSGACNAIAPLLKNGPVVVCLSPGVHPDEGSFVFSPAPSTVDLAIVTARYAKAHGWKKLAFLFSTDGSGIDGERVIAQVFQQPENKAVNIIDIEHFGVTDLSAAAQLAKIKAAQPDAVYVWATGTPSATALRGIQDVGITVPVLISYSNDNVAQMNSYKGYLPAELLSAGVPAMVPPEQLPRGPLRDRVASLDREFKAAGVRPDALEMATWDAALLAVEALKRLGPATTAAQLREYLAGLRGFTGITGAYDFKAIPQRGINWKSSVLMTRWDPAKDTFVAAGPLGS